MENQQLNLVLATPAGFEPATCPLGGGCSILLSHGAARALFSAMWRACHRPNRPFRGACLRIAVRGNILKRPN